MIEILLATYNGEKYIREQLGSLLCQTEQDFVIRAADDASSDGTAAVLQEYAARYPDKISFLIRKKGTGSARNNFFNLMAESKAPYVMTCDQDDRWNPDKVRLTFDKMKQLEEKYGQDCPLLVHTDLAVADEKMQLISPSMYALQHTAPNLNTLSNLLTQNVVTGCTMMVNRALINKLQTIPLQAILHDWWCALVASACGHIGFVPIATMLYRQHEDNQVGAKKARSIKYMLKRFLSSEQSKKEQAAACRQAKAFADAYQTDLSSKQLSLLNAYASLTDRGFFARRWVLIRYGFWEKGMLRKMKQLFTI